MTPRRRFPALAPKPCRPTLRLTAEAAAAVPLNSGGPGAFSCSSPGSSPIHLLDRREVLAEFCIEPALPRALTKSRLARRTNADDEREHASAPERESRPDGEPADSHPCLPPSMNPTPRTVCSSFFSNGSSILRRSRAIVTSMTLSSGVARAVTRHTSRASISRDTTRPQWRSRYSRISNSWRSVERLRAPGDFARDRSSSEILVLELEDLVHAPARDTDARAARKTRTA